MPSQGKVSGRLVVFVLFSGALLMWGALFVVSYRQKGSRGISALSQPFPRDSAVAPDSLRAWLLRYPMAWVRVTSVEGQGFVRFVPCYSSNSALTVRIPPDSLPRLVCEYCDSLTESEVTGLFLDRNDSILEFRLDSAQGRVQVLPVRDSLLARFPDTPFRERLLLWTRGNPPGRGDTLFFVPKEMENEFELLRAEDENPEGCGVEGE